MLLFLKKNKGNFLFVVLLALLFVPQTRIPIQVFVQRIVSFSPSEISEEERETLLDYNWLLSDMEGKTVHLKSSQGNVTIINVWATWCPPCIAEMPSFQKLYERYGEEVDFYFISQDSAEKQVAFMVENGYTFPIYIPQKASPQKLNATALPTTFVIAKNGNILIKKIGAADWNGDTMHSVLERSLHN